MADSHGELGEASRCCWATTRSIKGDGIEEHQGESREKLVAESKSLVDDLADLAVHLFAMYDRELLMEFLKSSTFYTFEKVSPPTLVSCAHAKITRQRKNAKKRTTSQN